MPTLIRNAIITPDGTMLQSTHVHDYVTYVDKNGKTYMVDGGLQYLKRSIHEDQIEASLYDDAGHNVQREVLTWGTYGKDGNQPLKRVAVKDMETDHIKAVLKECNPSKVFKNCMKAELLSRGVDV